MPFDTRARPLRGSGSATRRAASTSRSPIRGSTPAGRATGDGLGLIGMRERAALVGGSLVADRSPVAVSSSGPTCRSSRTRPDDRASLIADDERLVRAGLRMILSAEADIEIVGEAADGREAVELAERHRPDVVLMDIRMPIMDGLEATRRILAMPGAPRVIVLTTFELDEYVYEALRIGASGFLRKDAPEADLLDAIRVAAAGGSIFSRSVTERLVRLVASRRPTLDPPPGMADLTRREFEVFGLIADGLSNREIAERLGVSEHTAKTHVAHVLGKLELRDRIQAVILAYEANLVGASDPQPLGGGLRRLTGPRSPRRQDATAACATLLPAIRRPALGRSLPALEEVATWVPTVCRTGRKPGRRHPLEAIVSRKPREASARRSVSRVQARTTLERDFPTSIVLDCIHPVYVHTAQLCAEPCAAPRSTRTGWPHRTDSRVRDLVDTPRHDPRGPVAIAPCDPAPCDPAFEHDLLEIHQVPGVTGGHDRTFHDGDQRPLGQQRLVLDRVTGDARFRPNAKPVYEGDKPTFRWLPLAGPRPRRRIQGHRGRGGRWRGGQ